MTLRKAFVFRATAAGGSRKPGMGPWFWTADPGGKGVSEEETTRINNELLVLLLR